MALLGAHSIVCPTNWQVSSGHTSLVRAQPLAGLTPRADEVPVTPEAINGRPLDQASFDQLTFAR